MITTWTGASASGSDAVPLTTTPPGWRVTEFKDTVGDRLVGGRTQSGATRAATCTPLGEGQGVVAAAGLLSPVNGAIPVEVVEMCSSFH